MTDKASPLGKVLQSYESARTRMDDAQDLDGADPADRAEFLDAIMQMKTVNWTVTNAMNQRYQMLNRVINDMK